MPVHDWRKVDAGTYHDFHNAWIIHLKEALNEGVLPKGYYARSEQHGGGMIGDVLTLSEPESRSGRNGRGPTGGLSLLETPPKVRKIVHVQETYRVLRRTITIRHVSGDRIIALVEIVSRANKDRLDHVLAFARKVESALASGINVLLIDPFPPGKFDPDGMHAAIWGRFSADASESPPAKEPVVLAAYRAREQWPEAFLEFIALGRPLPDMPVFLLHEQYVKAPLESTYRLAYKGIPQITKEILEGPRKLGKRTRGE